MHVFRTRLSSRCCSSRLSCPLYPPSLPNPLLDSQIKLSESRCSKRVPRTSFVIWLLANDLICRRSWIGFWSSSTSVSSFLNCRSLELENALTKADFSALYLLLAGGSPTSRRAAAECCNPTQILLRNISSCHLSRCCYGAALPPAITVTWGWLVQNGGHLILSKSLALSFPLAFFAASLAPSTTGVVSVIAPTCYCMKHR